MEFTHQQGSGRKSGKFALVVAVHVALGVMFVNGMSMRTFTPPHDDGIIFDPLPPEIVDPPPPPPPPQFKQIQPNDKLVVPMEEVVIEHPNKPDLVTREFDPTVDKHMEQGPVVKEMPQVVPPVKPSVMHTAVLADANACALPAYPKSAIRAEEEGTTTLALMVGTDGRVSSARVERSSGYRDLDRAAVDALTLCRFKPATCNGVPEAGWAQLAYVWKLD